MMTGKLGLPYVFLLMFILTVALYYGSLYEIYLRPHSISLDDHQLMNDLFNHQLTAKDLFIHPHTGKYYRPMLTFSYLIDQRVSGTHQFGYRVTNVLLHATNVLLVFLIARLLCIHLPDREAIAFFSALLFAVHPAAVESVCWISGRTDLLAVFWSLLAIFLYLTARPTGKLYLLVAALLFAFLAALSKETGIVAFFILAAWELFYYQGQAGGEKKRNILFASAGSFFVLSYILLRTKALSTTDLSISLTVQGLLDKPVMQNLGLLLASIGFYLKKFIYPFPLTVAINQIAVLPYAIVGLVILLAILFGILFQKTIQSFLSLWALFGVAPAAVISLSSIAWTPWAERYLYFPLVPLSILTGITVFRFAALTNKKTPELLLTGGYLVIVTFASSTVYRSFQWNDNLRLWQDAYLKSPTFNYGAVAYADALAEKGRTDEAEKILLKTVALPGPKHLVYFRLGQLNSKKGDFKKARDYYLKALAEGRTDTNLVLVGPAFRKEILLYLAGLDMPGNESRGKPDYHNAIGRMLEAHQEDPSDNTLLYRIAKVYLLSGDKGHAESYFVKFLSKGGEDRDIQAARKMLQRIKSKKEDHGAIALSQN